MIFETNFSQWVYDRIDPIWADTRMYPQQVLKLEAAGVPSHSAAFIQSALEGPYPLWAWGVFPYWEGVGEAWMYFDKRAAGHALRIIREARKFIARVEGEHGFHRIFGQFDTRITANYKLAKILGFEEEGLLRKHVADHDYASVARVH